MMRLPTPVFTPLTWATRADSKMEGPKRGAVPQASTKLSGQAAARSENSRHKAAFRNRLEMFARIAVPAILLTTLFIQLYLGARNKSATLDEQNHIARGLAFLRTGDLRLNLIHPPLINMICALPLLRDAKVKLPLDDESWRTSDFNAFGVQFLWVKNSNGPSIVARARIPTMVLTAVLGVTVYFWASEIYGWIAGVLALSLLCFDPNILAHGALATNDLGMSCFTCLAAYAFWRMLARPGWFRAVLAGLCLGLALTAKFSAVFLLPALPAVAIAAWSLSPRKERTIDQLKGLLRLAPVVILAAFIALWAVYGFQISYDPVSGFPIPAKAYIDGLQFSKATIFQGDRTFLLGMYSQTGWWYYFPIAFLVKTPLPTLFLFGGAIVFAACQRDWKRSAVMLTPVVIYFALALLSPLEIGYRHLLPTLPFLFVFTGQLANFRGCRLNWIRCTILALIAWLVIGAVRIYPDYLTYFNEAAGGPSGGARILADSNLDWGQDLPGLRDYMTREHIDRISLSYFGSARPEAYGITNFDPLPSYPYNYPGVENKVSELSNPPSGVYAISVTNLQGVFFKNHDLYRWFRERKPDAIIGHTIYVYRLK